MLAINSNLIYIGLLLFILAIIIFLFIIFAKLYRESHIFRKALANTDIKPTDSPEVECENDDINIDERSETMPFKTNSKVSTNGKMTIHYSDYPNVSFIEVKSYLHGKLQKSECYKLEHFQFENGVLKNFSAIASMISNDFDEIYPISFLISSKRIFKNTISLPKINHTKALGIYQREIKEAFPDYKAEYKAYRFTTKHKLGYIFYTVFVPLDIILVLEKIVKLLNSKCYAVTPFACYIKESLNSYNNYAAIYVKNGLCTMFSSSANSIYGFEEFEYAGDMDDLCVKFSTYAGKHELELAKAKIENVIVNDSRLLQMQDSLPSVNMELFDFDSNLLGSVTKHKRGFSLVEVVVAIAVFAICIGAIISAYLLSARAYDKSKEYFHFEQICQNLDYFYDNYSDWNERLFGSSNSTIYFNEKYEQVSSNGKYILKYELVNDELIVNIQNINDGYYIIKDLNYGVSKNA